MQLIQLWFFNLLIVLAIVIYVSTTRIVFKLYNGSWFSLGLIAGWALSTSFIVSLLMLGSQQ